MQQPDVKMFAEEISRLEAEAAEAQQIILTQTERLRSLEQRITALKSVVSGTQTRMSISAGSDAEMGIPATTEPVSDSPLPAERSEISTALFGRQRAALPEAADVGVYRAASSPLPSVASYSPTTPPVAPALGEPGTPEPVQPDVPKPTPPATRRDDDSHLVDQRL